MNKKMTTIFCLFFLTFSTTIYAAASVKLIDFLVSSSGVTELLGKNGIKGIDAKQIESYLTSSLGSLSGGKILSQKEFKAILGRLPVAGEDATLRKELQVLLDKNEGDLKKEDVVKAINHIIYLANRHGKSILITCAECVSDSLAKNGFKFTVENIKNTESLKILNDIIPNNPKDLNTFISSKVKRLGFGDYSKVTPEMMPKSDEKTFALFLASYESGSSDFKELAAMIKKLSTKKAQTNIFDSSNPNKLWKVVTNDLSQADAAKLTDILKETDLMASKENLKIEEAFNNVLRKKAEMSDELMDKFKSLKTKRCFFK